MCCYIQLITRKCEIIIEYQYAHVHISTLSFFLNRYIYIYSVILNNENNINNILLR